MTPRPLPTPEEVARVVRIYRSSDLNECADMLEALAEQLAIADNTIVQFRDKIIALEAGLRESQAKVEALAARVRELEHSAAEVEFVVRGAAVRLEQSAEPFDAACTVLRMLFPKPLPPAPDAP